MPRTKTTRRAKDEGSLFQRESDKLWGGFITVESEDGKQKKAWVYSKRQGIAKKKLDKLKESQRRGAYVSRSDVTLGERVDHWLLYDVGDIDDGTREKYRRNIDNHIKPDLGKREIQKIERSDMTKWLTDKEQHLAPETIKILLSILNRVFDLAVIDKVISSSPLLRVKRAKKVVKKKRRALTLQEEQKILETALKWGDNKKHNKQVYAILFTEYGSGLRRSEI